MKKRQVTLLSLLVLATALTVGCGSDGTPAFTKLPFSSNRSSDPSTPLFLMNLDGSHVTPVAYSGDSFFSPSISADLKTIAFVSSPNVWVSKSDGSGSKQVTTLTDTDADNFSYVLMARISPNGKKIVFSTWNGAAGVYNVNIMNVDGTGLLNLTPTLPTDMNGGCYTGSFSANSRTITFACYGESGYGLYTVDATGSGTKTVVGAQAGFVDTPTFSPDGKKIVFVGFGFSVSGAAKSNAPRSPKPAFRNGLHRQITGGIPNNQGVFSVNLDGTGAVLVAANAFDAEILNSTLYYTVWDPEAGFDQIWKSNVDGSSAVKISDGTADDWLDLSVD